MDIGYQAVQSAHALREFIHLHSDIDSQWYNNSNYLALLVVSNVEELNYLLHKAEQQGIAVAAFHEPDLNNELTAIAIAPGEMSRRLCRRLKLLGS